MNQDDIINKIKEISAEMEKMPKGMKITFLPNKFMTEGQLVIPIHPRDFYRTFPENVPTKPNGFDDWTFIPVDDQPDFETHKECLEYIKYLQSIA